MSLKIEAIDATLGAFVTGVHLSKIDDDQWRSIEEAFLEYGVLVFPGQGLTVEEQAAFGRRFGEFDSLVAETGFTRFTNIAEDGTVQQGEDNPVVSHLRGNEGWHTDSSYMEVSAKLSMLSAHVVPPEGGETEWADMRAAYAALSSTTSAKIEKLAAFHSLRHSQKEQGLEPLKDVYGYDEGPKPLRPLVKVHPETGRPALFIGRHAHDIPGLERDESAELLRSLLEVACQPPRVYKHRWNVGDLVAWDNRCVLHRAHPYDPTMPREMVHTRIAGSPATEASLPVP